MKFKFLPLVIIVLIPFLGYGQTVLEKQSFLHDNVELLIPKDLVFMSEKTVDEKYPNRTLQPDVILTDKSAEVNILISLVNQHLRPDQVPAFKDFQIGVLKKAHPNAKWLEDGVRTINGKNVGYFKLISNTADQPVFNYYFFTDLDGKALIITFNCTGKLLPEWKETAETIVSSLKVK